MLTLYRTAPLVPFVPFTNISRLRQQMERLFDDFAVSVPHTRTPAVNLYENTDRFLLTAAVPGLRDEDLSVKLHDNVLTISGRRHAEVPEGYAQHRRERAEVAFTRSVRLPVRVDAEKTSATLRDGILKVEVFKHPDALPRQITVGD